jgi:hypothetical protein
MQSVPYGFHAIRELGKIGSDRAIIVAPVRPAVIENDEVISKIPEAIFYDEIGGPEQQVGTNVASKGIPIILFGAFQHCGEYCVGGSLLPIPLKESQLVHCCLVSEA